MELRPNLSRERRGVPLSCRLPRRTSAACLVLTTATSSSIAADTLDSPSGLGATTNCYPAGRPAPAFRSVSSASSGGPTVTVTSPATQAGDVLIAMATSESNPDEVNYTATGWTRLQQVGNSSYDLLGAVFWRRATASEPASHAFQLGDPDPGAVIIAAYSGVDSVTPIDASGAQFVANSSSVTAPSVTTTTAPTRLVSGLAVDGPNTVAAPAGQTSRKIQTVSGGVIGLADESFATTGATGTRAVALGANHMSAGMTVALRGLSQPSVT